MKTFTFRVWRSCATALVLFVSGYFAADARALADGDASPADAAPVMTVNGLPVSVAEYRLVMQSRTAEVSAYFKRTHNRDDGVGYWRDDGAAESPIRKLRELVQTELVRIKVIQGLALKKGVITDASYATFVQKLSAENLRRKKAVAANQVVYGPRQYREAIYYAIIQGEIDHRLRGILVKDPEAALTVSEADIARCYEAERDKLADKTLADVRDKIVDVLQRERYDRFIRTQCGSARVEVNGDAVAALVPRIDS